LSGVDDGFDDPAGRSFIRAWDYNENNLMINSYNGVWTFDHDDCSQFVQDSDNFMVFGGACYGFRHARAARAREHAHEDDGAAAPRAVGAMLKRPTFSFLPQAAKITSATQKTARAT
jgi:hypothetical protein